MAAEITLLVTWPAPEYQGILLPYRVRVRDDQGTLLQQQETTDTYAMFGPLAELTTYQVELAVYSPANDADATTPQTLTLTTPEGAAGSAVVQLDWEAPASGDALQLLDNRKQLIEAIDPATPPATFSGALRYAYHYIELTRASGDVEQFWLYTPPKTLPDVHSTLLALSTGAGYNPHPTPVPNPTAIARNGQSSVLGAADPLKALGYIDQRDGSGGHPTAPTGVASDPTRRGILEGNTTDHYGNPVSRQVRVFERATGRIVREAWSTNAGYYRFIELDPHKRFTIVAHDHKGTYNAVIADNAQPELPA